MQNRTDEELVRLVAGGDVSAFEFLVKRHQRKLYSIAYHFVRDRHAAEDIVQESLISFYKHINSLDNSRHVASYLYVIAKNSAVSYLRSRKHHSPLSEAEEVAEADLPEDVMIRAEDSSFVSRALSKLPSRYKKVLTLYYFDEVSYQEIGNLLRMPINTVRTHLKRGKKLLSRIFLYENY